MVLTSKAEVAYYYQQNAPLAYRLAKQVYTADPFDERSVICYLKTPIVRYWRWPWFESFTCTHTHTPPSTQLPAHLHMRHGRAGAQDGALLLRAPACGGAPQERRFLVRRRVLLRRCAQERGRPAVRPLAPINQALKLDSQCTYIHTAHANADTSTRRPRWITASRPPGSALGTHSRPRTRATR